jgi:predicted transcriptional regulator
LSFNRKRDRIQIIAEILGSCKSPKTQTYIRRQTNISYDALQSCIMQLVLRQWLKQVEEESGQKKLAITEKGMDFLEKWVEIQSMINKKNKGKMMSMQASRAQRLMVQPK